MKAALGGVSVDGMGTPEFDVTHSGGGPWAFVANQPGGSAGGVIAIEVFTQHKQFITAGWARGSRR